jgi:hypothetical protein
MSAWTKSKNTPPDAGAVMARAIILKFIFAKGLATPPPEFLEQCKARWTIDEWNKFMDDVRNRDAQQIENLRQIGLWEVMEDIEHTFMQANPTELTQRDLIDANWLPESIVCLLWALGYISDLSAYDQRVDQGLTNKLPTSEPVKILVKKAALRTRESIDKQRDLAELWHWRSRTRQLLESGQTFTLPKDMTIDKVLQITSAKAAKDGVIPSPIGSDFPAFGKAYRDLTDEEYSLATSIAMERHHAFNWLCGFAPGNHWAETPTDT